MPVEKLLGVSKRKDPVMPDVRVDIKTPGAVTPQSDYLHGFKVVPRCGHGKYERRLLHGVEQLSPIEVVVHVPDYRRFAGCSWLFR